MPASLRTPPSASIVRGYDMTMAGTLYASGAGCDAAAMLAGASGSLFSDGE